jgi:hypothetical protein
MTMQWVATRARTGEVIAYLPHLDIPTISAVIGSYTLAEGTMPVQSAPQAWERATLPKASTLVLLDDEAPLWGGLITRRRRQTAQPIKLSLMTLEGWLDGVFVRDTLVHTTTGQNAIIADLVDRYIIDGTLPGLPLRVEGGTGGTARACAWSDKQDRAVLSVLSELAGLDGGPEWTIGWEHLSGPERYCPVLRVADRIGQSPIAGLAPPAMFDMPGSVMDAVFVEDWSSGKGATDVMATAPAVSDERPQSPHQTSADADRPRVELRWRPSTSATDVPTLTDHAVRALADLANGGRSLALKAALSTAPRLGKKWTIGDDVGFQIASPEFPRGLSGTARAIGWEMVPEAASRVGSISPVLVLPGEAA